MSRFLFVTDLDNTLVGDDLAMAELNHHLAQHRQQHQTQIVYSTGRSLTSYRKLTSEKDLLEPDVLISAVGTEIYHKGSETPDAAWSAKLSQGWDRDKAVATAAHFADLTPQSESEQRPFKASYFLTEQAAAEVLPQLEQMLRDRGLDIQLIYSGGKDLDILPRQANKGMAMTFLRQTLEIEPVSTVACGDSGNDLSLFTVGQERGIIVGNALPELLQWYHTHANSHHYLATAHCAAGILEGLRHFKFLSEE
ncbi:sucrose-phosphate phosphatase [Kovacikia minuta CCNUW1]|uniref:sucrose-phosphate phosphatase n=1 Tax=Kovacikia minuta TaxID=2931930 RepID=UPI001CCCE516|nr:sucrose-phosphate phosphatase [Kovacikia minuta]UBF24638.1 sucrose-phosphate phosphatase [Kovacikia minuta CCNUW1]